MLWFNTSYAFDKSETIKKNVSGFLPKNCVLLFQYYRRVNIMSCLFTFM